MTTYNVSNALQWLEDKGWSELIDERWTLEVYHELQTSGLNLTDARYWQKPKIHITPDSTTYVSPTRKPTKSSATSSPTSVSKKSSVSISHSTNGMRNLANKLLNGFYITSKQTGIIK